MLNNTRVIPARIYGQKETGGRVEALLIEELENGRWETMLRPGRRLKPGTVVQIDGTDATFTVEAKLDQTFEISFQTDNVLDLLEQCGQMPLPPYIQREAADDDLERYQTVFAEEPGAVAAPTAGLHFTPEVLAQAKAKGVTIAHVTLHVGIGTFRPVQVDRIDDHEMHFERYELTEDSATVINSARAGGGRVVAVGTTSVRTLETVADEQGIVHAGKGRTNVFLYPPYQPKAVDLLLTNFHLPKSTLLMLVSCFSNREDIMAAYQQAIEARMRFFSYGDCMLLH